MYTNMPVGLRMPIDVKHPQSPIQEPIGLPLVGTIQTSMDYSEPPFLLICAQFKSASASLGI